MCGTQDKNPRDLLMHLHCWHQLIIKFHNDNMSGKPTPFLPEGYTWRTTPEMNHDFWEEYQAIPLAEAIKLVTQSHKQVMKLIESHTNEELFTKNHYKWTGTSTLGSYFASATSSHYDWAIKLMKKMP